MDVGLQNPVDLVPAFADPTRVRLLALLDGHEETRPRAARPTRTRY